MAKMGYIHGSGLGKDGIGRVEPVSAVVLPAGKSLGNFFIFFMTVFSLIYLSIT